MQVSCDHDYGDAMCGRLVATWTATQLADFFTAIIDGDQTEALSAPRYNVPPTSSVWMVIDDDDHRRHLVCSHWGLIPRWASDTSGASSRINARSENLFDRPTYRPLLARHRCLVPINAFYEWGSGRQPYVVRANDDTLLEVAGLWTSWRSPDGVDRVSCTLLTTQAHGPLAEVHHRMPVALTATDRDMWLERQALHPDEISSMVERSRDQAARQWLVQRVSRRVNSVAFDDPSLIEPEPPEPIQDQLFSG